MTNWKPGPKSRDLFEAAAGVIPGGVNSPVRAFASVGLQPFFVDRAKGPHVWDVDGNRYVDFMGSWGPMILGHRNGVVHEALVEAAEKGTSFGASHAMEVELARMVMSRIRSIDKLRLVSSGTEATMSAIRLARGFTKRDIIIKFEGCYHGHADSFLINAGSGAATFGVPSSPGVPAAVAQSTLTAPYNDLDAVEQLLENNKDAVAAIIVEPVAGNMGCVLPGEGFLQGLRDLCDRHGALLVFDEVITGFRVAAGGAQERYGVSADLTTLGKILGGGMPVGAFGGRADIMDCIAPVGSVYQAGTLSGNPLAVACGLAILGQLGEEGVYETLEDHGAQMEKLLLEAAGEAGSTISLSRVGSMMSFFFTEGKVRNFTDAKGANHEKFNRFFETLLAEGVSIAPSGYEALFVSTVHTNEVLDGVRQAFRKAFVAAETV